MMRYMAMEVDVPLHVGWQCTARCNLRCTHCYADAGERSPDELSTEEAKNLIDSVSDLGARSLVFTGGEPFLREDITDLIGHARDSGLVPIIATNGTLIDEEMASFLKEVGAAVAINMPAVDPALNEMFTGVGNSFEMRNKGLMHCLERCVPVSVGVAVTALNIGEVARVIDFCLQKGISCDVLATIPVGRASSELLPSPVEYERLLRSLLRDYSAVPMNAIGDSSGTSVSVYEPFYARIVEEERGEMMPRLCSTGKTMHVMEDGSVRTCVYLPHTFGNVRRKGIETIWKGIRNSPYIKRLTDPGSLKGACGTCPHRESCGGCRARALALTGDPLMEDPMCTRNRTMLLE